MIGALVVPGCTCSFCLTTERERAEAKPDHSFVPPEGVKLDAGKPRMDLLPFDALASVADVLRYGAEKYAPRNWEKGMAWGRLLGAAMRHLGAWSIGIDTDKESGLPHLAHAACCVLMLLALTDRHVGTDDRCVVETQAPRR